MPTGFPTTLFRYDLLKDSAVGRGGYGLVWKAHDHLFGRPVAIKTINESLLWFDDLRVQRAFARPSIRGHGPPMYAHAEYRARYAR
jgi:hypothetical protein